MMSALYFFEPAKSVFICGQLSFHILLPFVLFVSFVVKLRLSFYIIVLG